MQVSLGQARQVFETLTNKQTTAADFYPVSAIDIEEDSEDEENAEMAEIVAQLRLEFQDLKQKPFF